MGNERLIKFENDIKDMHEEILFPEKKRFTTESSPYDYKQEMENVLKVKGEHSVKDEI